MAGASGAPLLLAHRGDHRRVAENTLAAFAAARAVPGCDGVELDVRASADGIPVVLHDATLRRVQGSPGRAADRTAADLATLGVPTLAEVLETLGPGAWVDIELKEDVVGPAASAIRSARGDPPARIVVSSFETAVLAHLRAEVPLWRTWLNAINLAAGTVARAADLGCTGIAAEWHAVGERAMAQATDAGIEVAAWTVRRRDAVERLVRLGVVAIVAEDGALGRP